MERRRLLELDMMVEEKEEEASKRAGNAAQQSPCSSVSMTSDLLRNCYIFVNVCITISVFHAEGQRARHERARKAG